MLGDKVQEAETEVYEFWLWEENFPAYEYFNEVGDQWNVSAFGELLSLNGQFVYDWLKDDMPDEIKKAKALYKDILIIASGFKEEYRRQQNNE